MKKNLIILISLLALALIGCSSTKKTIEEKPLTTEAPIYAQSNLAFRLSEDANPYRMEFVREGFFYFAMGEEYQFFYQTYDSREAIPFCKIEDGVVKAFSGVAGDGKDGLAVLRIGDEACILKYDGTGEKYGEIIIDGNFNDLEKAMQFLALPDGGYVIGMSGDVYFLDDEGHILNDIRLKEGNVKRFVLSNQQEVFAVVQKQETNQSELCLTRLDAQKGQGEITRNLQKESMNIFAFEEGFVSVLQDRVVFFRAEGEDEEPLIDLTKQNLVASQMQCLFGNREEIRIVSLDPDRPEEGYVFTLRVNAATEGAENAGNPGDERDAQAYAPDGRRIVRVAIPQEYYYQMEFHVKKYNQISADAFVEVERYEDDLESFLGKGNQPDVIMMKDQTELEAYVQKDILADFLPLFEAQEKYSLDGVIPKAREILGATNADAMYAMAGRFRLLLRTSDGTEYDADGTCDAVHYLKWYDCFLTEREIGGMGQMDDFLYANVRAFYDENTAEVFFDSEEFRELMQAYKEVYDRHSGNLDTGSMADQGYKEREIARGPRWCASYSAAELAEANVKKEGIPGTDGKSHVFMKLEFPMSILTTSDCKAEAFDFIMYYNSLSELLMKGDSESSFGKSGTTSAIFSVYEDVLREQIYESERPYITLDGVEYFFTDEQNQQLQELIDSAVADSKTQKYIYLMLTEEMDSYLKGGKSLDSACEILQNRARLYLLEQE